MEQVDENSDGSGPELDTDNVDRIVLRRLERRRLDHWLTILNKRFDGMIRVTKSDLANFVIRRHAEELSESEIDLIETELYDEVRWLNWALAKIRLAKREGVVMSLDELMVKRKAKAAPKRSSKLRSRNDHDKSANDAPQTLVDDSPNGPESQ